MKIATVIVTYNRLPLLKECVEAVMRQNQKSDKLFIINNCSTDGTDKYLASLNETGIECVNLNENTGGAGGFHLGLKLAVKEGYDYVWLMDDDCIPQENALANLSKAITRVDCLGFAASKVIWTDGAPHKMNLTAIKKTPRDRSIPFNKYSQEDFPAFLINNATFVSVLISAEAVKKVGLPIKEFFIWHDDIEYTDRIVDNGFTGVYIDNSIVVHKTGKNYFARPQSATGADAWKFYYQARNTTYIKKKEGVLLTFLSNINKYRVFVHRLNKRQDKKDLHELKRQFRKGLWDGLFFHPTIEKID